MSREKVEQILIENTNVNLSKVHYPLPNLWHIGWLGDDPEVAQGFIEDKQVLSSCGKWIKADFRTHRREAHWPHDGIFSTCGKWVLRGDKKRDGSLGLFLTKHNESVATLWATYGTSYAFAEKVIDWFDRGCPVDEYHQILFGGPNMERTATVHHYNRPLRVDLFSQALDRLPEPDRIDYYNDTTNYNHNTLNTGRGISSAKTEPEKPWNIAFLYDANSNCYAAVSRDGDVKTRGTIAVGRGYYNSSTVSYITIVKE